jgi:hypothetical protein
VKLAVPTAAAEELIAKLDELHAEAQVQAKKENPKVRSIKESNLPYKTSEENPDETIFAFKKRASFKDNEDRMIPMRLPLFDAGNKPLPKDTRIGGGSILRVSFEPVMYYTAKVGAGITLRMKAVKVIELKEYNGGSAENFGFEPEDGYAAEADGEFPGEEAAPATTSAAGGSDF